MQIFLTYKTIFKTKDLFVDLPYLIFPHEKFEYKLNISVSFFINCQVLQLGNRIKYSFVVKEILTGNNLDLSYGSVRFGLL